jgi:hypothetical protein
MLNGSAVPMDTLLSRKPVGKELRNWVGPTDATKMVDATDSKSGSQRSIGSEALSGGGSAAAANHSGDDAILCQVRTTFTRLPLPASVTGVVLS